MRLAGFQELVVMLGHCNFSIDQTEIHEGSFAEKFRHAASAKDGREKVNQRKQF